MTTQRLKPVDLNIRRSGELRIQWSDGVDTSCTLVELRRACPCAGCRAARDETAVNPLRVLVKPPDLKAQTRVENAEIVGHYALRIQWGDGHNTGIYDFGLLRTLGESGAARPGGESD